MIVLILFLGSMPFDGDDLQEIYDSILQLDLCTLFDTTDHISDDAKDFMLRGL